MTPSTAVGLGQSPTLSTSFDLETFAATRRGVTSTARACGLDGEALDGFTLATGEVVANAIVHGGGTGILLMWSDGSHLRCQVSDNGPGIPADRIPPPPPAPPPPHAVSGRGLWLAYQCCQLEFRTSRHGTTVELRTRVPLAVDADRPRE